MSTELGSERENKSPGFSTTRWSIILDGANLENDDEKAKRALTHLCRIYWRPIFSFVCRRGASPEDAQDLTQEFFAMILQTNWLQQADRSRGRFRSFLLTSLKHFITDANDKKTARKRGGGVSFVSWDDWMAEAPSQLTISAHSLETIAPERLFDLRWAATVVELALRRLGEECERKGKLRLFDGLSGHLAAERADVSYADLALALGVSEAVVKRQLHNMRQRFRWLLRDEVSRTVINPSDVDDEIRHLCAALATET